MSFIRRSRHKRLMLVVSIGALLAGCASSPQVSTLTVTDAWARPTPASASGAVAYFSVVSPVEDELLSVSTPRAEKAKLHVSSPSDKAGSGDHSGHTGGSMSMSGSALVLKPGQPVTLAPGGTHVMLSGVKEPLIEGTSFTLVLTFRNAGAVSVEVAVSSNPPT